jgi:hypothetical protein
MGFTYRKSVNLGPLRVNLSKSGLGHSVGGRGFRARTSARRKKYCLARSDLRHWVDSHGPIFEESTLIQAWEAQGQRGGAEHHVHPVSGVLAFDLHEENVVRLEGSDELVVIDPFICLARRGTWASLKLAEIELPEPPDDQFGGVEKSEHQ